jgi:hypothetical protein
LYELVPKEASCIVVVLVVGIAALAAAVAQDWPLQFFIHAYGRGYQFPGWAKAQFHFGSVDGLAYLDKLVTATVGTGKGDIHCCVFRVLGLYI